MGVRYIISNHVRHHIVTKIINIKDFKKSKDIKYIKKAQTWIDGDVWWGWTPEVKPNKNNDKK